MRLVWLTLLLALAVIIPFAIWGGNFESWLTLDGTVTTIRSYGPWGGVAVVVLLISDLFLPIPATPVMSAAGLVYGWFIGGLLSAGGTFLAGVLAYVLCRFVGHRAAERIVGPADLAKGERLFARRGAWIVALSRALPVLPEIVSCLAGLTRMPARAFVVSLACGSVPLGFIYAAIGAAGVDRPGLALALSAALPALLWMFAQRLIQAD